MGNKKGQGDRAFAGPRNDGMTLRDWFAGQAMSSMLGAADEEFHLELVTTSYKIADLMIQERNK